ncbi:hypothetical protein ABLU14_17310, partial [Acinetobacter nosocomialis]
RGIANSKIGFGDLILLLRYFFKLKVSTHPSLFRQNIGKKPSLKIDIIKSTALYEFENYCWVQYQEHQQTDETETVRTSTACIKVEGEKCYWVYLHETLVPSSS